MQQQRFDVVIVGMGLGATAIARQIGETDANIAMLPGAGRPRFTHLDGGVISAAALEFTMGTIESAPIHTIGGHSVFRRDHLESWAINRVRNHVTIVDNFEEHRAIPHHSGALSIHDAGGQRELIAQLVILTEGANPKIGIAARIREDFPPEDLIHFGRTFLTGIGISGPVTGAWRTSWNMPAWYSAIPLPDGTLVSASARIENIMRPGRDAREALIDFLRSSQAGAIGLNGPAGEIGTELVPLRSGSKPIAIGSHNIAISPDANGTIDARTLARFEFSLQSGTELGAMITREWPNLLEWDDPEMSSLDVFTSPKTPYYDSSETGFIEDRPGPRRGLLQKLFKR